MRDLFLGLRRKLQLFNVQMMTRAIKMMNLVSEVPILGLLWHGYHDAIGEGDGGRVLR